MSKTTSIDKLESAIQGILDEYVDTLTRDVDNVAEKVGKEGVKALKSKSKESFKGTGKYAKSWKSTTEKGRVGTKVILHNTMPGLPHLLENGHAKRGGGRVPGKAHIAPVQQRIESMFEKSLEEVIQK